ncbi:MAG: Bug family tripartite tricarboxylate transporter substrate binding protein [Alphaproteobacteria bacterium]
MGKRTKRLRALASFAMAASCLYAACSAPANADALSDFYSSARMDFIVGSKSGSGYDVYSRALSRHMRKYIPGQPTIIVKNMPGVGGIIATNYLYNQAARDGSVIGMNSRTMPLVATAGASSVQFKLAEFDWIGSPQSSNRVCIVKKGSKVQKAEDLFKEEAVLGGTGSNSGPTTTPILLSKMFGMKFKVVKGYASTPEMNLALDRGEIEGYCGGLPPLEVVRPGAIAKGDLVVLFNLEKKPITGVAGISAPSIYSFTTNDEQRQMIGFYNASVELGFPVMTPPGVPKDRLAALRQAFDKTMTDPDFVKEAHAAGLDVEPSNAEQITEIVKGIMNTPKSTIDKVTEITGGLEE